MWLDVQKLQEVWSVVETQKREALEAERRHDETVVKLRQEDAARMREAALSRHQLLQQVESLTTSNGSSDAAMVFHSGFVHSCSNLQMFLRIFSKNFLKLISEFFLSQQLRIF